MAQDKAEFPSRIAALGKLNFTRERLTNVSCLGCCTFIEKKMKDFVASFSSHEPRFTLPRT